MDAQVETGEKKPKGTQSRGRIGPDDVKAALAAAKLAKPGDELIHDLNDDEQPYLTLRRRGGSVRWLVRSYGKTKIIGKASGINIDADYLNLRDAREKAKRVYVELADSATGKHPWTVSMLCLRYQKMMSEPRWINNRKKEPSRATCDDIRLAFAQEAYQPLGTKRLTKLNRKLLDACREGIESYRQRQKFVSWFKTAMNWAADEHPDESGLTEKVPRWWEKLSAGKPSTEQMNAIEKRRVIHLQNKAKLSVEAIARTLVRHEEYVAGRTGEDKISPGVRWGIWWVSFTANRRLSTVRLLRDDLLEQDPLGEDGWGRAAWPADSMKAKHPFCSPLPSVVRDIAVGSIQDYKQLVANEHGDWPSRWVFASTRRFGRDADNDDVSVYPNSLNRYLQRMRADGALDGLPLFNPHLVRSAMGNFIEEKVSGVVASLVLAHKLPEEGDEAAQTTRDYYLTSQRMKEKTEGMRAWCEALIEAFVAAGGKMPEPRETRRRSKIRTKAPAR